MAAYAVMDGGVVVNIVEADADFATRLGLLMLTEGAGIGSVQNGEELDPPPNPPDPIE